MSEDQKTIRKNHFLPQNQSGLGDQAFNDATWAGFVLAHKKLGIDPKVLESHEQSQMDVLVSYTGPFADPAKRKPASGPGTSRECLMCAKASPELKKGT